jgi:hypothetical protein
MLGQPAAGRHYRLLRLEINVAARWVWHARVSLAMAL